MTTEEVLQLSELSRIALTPEEIERLPAEIAAILDYVSAVKDIVGTEAVSPAVGARYNVLRADEATNEPGQYTHVLLAEAPRRSGDYLVVNKILQQDE